MKEIRIHGRGGQGSVVTAELLAIAAYSDGLSCQAFPYLGGGGERRGAPVQAFCRINNEPIRLKCQIIEPNYLIVQDAGLIDVVDIFKGLQIGGTVLYNSSQTIEKFEIKSNNYKIYSFPATEIAMKTLGKPIMNTSMIGAFAALTGSFRIESLQKAIKEKFPSQIGENNILAMETSYNLAREMFGGK